MGSRISKPSNADICPLPDEPCDITKRAAAIISVLQLLMNDYYDVILPHDIATLIEEFARIGSRARHANMM